MVIGEASKNAPLELKNEYQDIPWKKIAGARDKMTHDYADIELDIIWNIIVKDLPDLKRAVDKYIAEHQEEIAELEKEG